MNDQDVPIIYLDTYSILGHVIFRHGKATRIEMSMYLKDFSTLYELCYKHEKEHSQFPLFHWRHLWIDTRDRFKIFTNEKLVAEYNKFKNNIEPETLKELLFIGLYNFVSLLHTFFIFLLIYPLVKKITRFLKMKFWRK